MGFYLREFFLDQFPKFWQGSLRACRSYYGDGGFNTEVAVNDFNGDLIPYLGRKVADIKFKVGDIVECVEGDELSRLGIVAAVPWTVDEVLAFNEKMHSHVLDYSDDCYMVYFLGSGDTHSHPLSCNVFSPARRVSLKLIEQLQKKLKEQQRNQQIMVHTSNASRRRLEQSADSVLLSYRSDCRCFTGSYFNLTAGAILSPRNKKETDSRVPDPEGS